MYQNKKVGFRGAIFVKTLQPKKGDALVSEAFPAHLIEGNPLLYPLVFGFSESERNRLHLLHPLMWDLIYLSLV